MMKYMSSRRLRPFIAVSKYDAQAQRCGGVVYIHAAAAVQLLRQ